MREMQFLKVIVIHLADSTAIHAYFPSKIFLALYHLVQIRLIPGSISVIKQINPLRNAGYIFEPKILCNI